MADVEGAADEAGTFVLSSEMDIAVVLLREGFCASFICAGDVLALLQTGSGMLALDMLL